MISWEPTRPFDALPPLPPANDVETKAILKVVIEARAALAALNEAAESMPNPAVLINSIPLLEAQASSEIENIVTTSDKLFEHANDPLAVKDPATREALGYRTALHHGFSSVIERPLTVVTAREVCSRVLGHDIDIRSRLGTFIGNPASGEAVYTPPVGRTLLLDKLGAWERFIHTENGLDPLV